jgi:hypothetical protein
MNEMKVVVVYVYPVFGEHHDTLAERFAKSYKAHLPKTKHELVVVSNGGPPTDKMRETFKDIPCRWLEHDDTGWDIGAFRKAAKEIPAELMVFFGGSAHILGAGWLKRMIAAWKKHGLALYGVTANTGDRRYGVWPHIRTTGFWLPPELLNAYPHKTDSSRESRYRFEHGPDCLTEWVGQQNLCAWMVTWSNEHLFPDWNVKNGYHNGDQSEVIIGDRLTTSAHYNKP